MWNIGDENVKLKGQMAGYGPAGTELSSVQRSSFPPGPPRTSISDKLLSAESSRKGETNFHIGKKIPDDVPSSYRGNLGHNLQNVSGGMTSDHKIQVANTQQALGNIFPGRDVQFTKSNIEWSQYGSYPLSDPGSFSTSLQRKDVDFQKSRLKNSGSMFQHTQPFSQGNASVGDFSHLSSSQHVMHGLTSQVEAGKFLSYGSEGVGSREKIHADFNPKDVRNLDVRSFFPLNNSSFGPIDAFDGSKKPSEFSQSWTAKTEMGGYKENFDGRSFNMGRSAVAEKDGYNMNVSGIPNFSINMITSVQTSAATERNQALGPHHSLGVSFHDKDQEKHDFGTPEKPSDCEGALLDNARLKRSSNEAHASKKADGLDGGNVNVSLQEEASREIGSTIKKPAAPCESQLSLVVDSTSRLPAVKVAPTTIEKLWDGTIQLNTSTAVSAVAVFKSGEKVSEVNWSKYVEVKGKVRLEAFEKFVQELPRSRTRALMVISLCWKVGSSETGLIGMKEVAKGYKEGQRVGFAQLCPGIDLYVCPRSDAIITILAKYGFFKGMAAVEDDQNSLIGCVVWRRNHPSSECTLKKPDKKDFPSLPQPLHSPSESAISSKSDQNSSITEKVDLGCNQVMPGFKGPVGAAGPLDPLASENESTNEAKHIDASVNVVGNNNNTAPVLTLPGHGSSVIPPMPMSAQKVDISLEDLSKCKSNSITRLGHDPEQKKPQISFEPSPLIPSGAPHKLEANCQSTADNDDDDLPEFDFGNAYGVALPDGRLRPSSQNHHPLGLPSHNQQFPVEVNKSSSVSIPLAIPSARTMPPNDAPNRQHAPHSFGLMQNALPKELGVPVHGAQPAVQTTEPSSTLGASETDKRPASPAAKSSFFAPKLAETMGHSNISVTSETPNSSQAAKSSSLQRRTIWDDDDDDDMPEWCPPQLEDGQQWSTAASLPRLLLPSPPASRSMPATTSRSTMPSSFHVPLLASIPSSSSKRTLHPPVQLQYDQNIPHQHQPGILGRQSLNVNRNIHLQTSPARRFGQSDWTLPESDPNQAKQKRRVSGWDVKPWEVKPDPWHGH